MNLVEYMPELAQPFAPQDIDFLPKNAFEKDGKTLCIGLPFTDPRTYQDRLNAVCPGEWSTQASITVASNKILALVTVTVCGVPHTDIGESFLTGEVRGKTRDEENTGTEAFAQAFKRACAQFGLGRYIYALPKQYLPYDKERKRFDMTASEKLEAVRKMYKAAGILYNAPKSPRSEAESSSTAQDDGQATEQQKASIRKLCAHLKRSEPEGEAVDSMTSEEAGKLIKELAASYRETVKAKNGQQAEPTAPGSEQQRPVTPWQVRRRSDELLGREKWDEAQTVWLKRLAAMDEMTQEDCEVMMRGLDGVVAQRAKKEAKAS